MIKYNQEFIVEEYEQAKFALKDHNLKKQVEWISAYDQAGVEIRDNNLLLREDFFLNLRDNRQITELLFRHPLTELHLRAIVALVEDNHRLVKVSMPGKTLPQNGNNLSAAEQFISNSLFLNVKMAGAKNGRYFDETAVELVIEDPRLVIYTDFCRALINHPTVRAIKITTLLTPHQLSRLTAVINQNLRISSVIIQGNDVFETNRKHDACVVGFPKHGYSSRKTVLYDNVKKLISAIYFNSCLAEVQAGEKNTLRLPPGCSDHKMQVILDCLALPQRVLTLEMSELNTTFLDRIPPASSLQVLRFTKRIEEFGAIADFVKKNTTVLDVFHKSYSGDEYESLGRHLPYQWDSIPNELSVNRYLQELQNNPAVKTISYKGGTLSTTKAQIFAQRLQQCLQMVNIHLENLRIGEAELLLILDILQRNGAKSIRRVSFINIALSSTIIRKLIEIIQQQPFFTCLELMNTQLMDTEIPALAEWLQSNPPLSILNLHGNKISNQGINTLCQALETNRRISSLSLGGNPFDTTALPAITRLLAANRFIARVSLLSSCMEEQDIKPFIDELKKTNYSIVHLEISHHTKRNTYRRGGFNGEMVSTPYKQKTMERVENFTTANSKKRDQLFTHVRRGEIIQIGKMFDEKVSPLSMDSNGDTALHVALAQNPLVMPVIICLVQRGSHNLLMNRMGIAPIDLLSQDSSPALCQLLQNPQGYFAEQAAAAPPVEPQQKKQKGMPASAPKGNSLLDRFVTVQKRSTQEPTASPPVVAVPPAPSIESVVAQSPAKIPRPLANSNDVAYFAAIHNNHRLLNQCLAQINPLHVYPDGNNLWHLAVSNGAIDCLHILFAYKDAGRTKNLFLQLPLHLACLHIDTAGSIEALELVLSAHSDLVNSPDAFAQTSLFCLAGGFNPYNYNAHSDRLRAEAARMLLHYNADPNTTIDDLNSLRAQVSVLQKGTARGLYRLAKVLMTSARCNLLHADAEGWSVLHYAVFFGQLEILARLLIQPQVNLDQTNIAGKTARQMARDNEFSAEVPNIPLIKERIEALFEARSRQRLFSPATEVHWVKNLTLRFGTRFGRNQDLVHSFNEEHAALQNAVRSQLHNAGNLLSASLTFVVSKGAHQPGADLSRVAIKVNITFTPKFHATQAWQSETSIEKSDSTSYFKKFKRSPDALNRIFERFDAAPEDIRTTAVDNVNQDGRPLSKMGIQRLFDSSHPSADDYDFEKHFHHSEGALFDHLQQPEIIDKILQTLRADSQFSPQCKIYAVVLNAFSKNYLCPDCMVATMGFQNTQEGAFFKILTQRLRNLGCVLPTKNNLRAITFFSAQQNYQQPRKSADEHSEVVIDIRAYPNNKILCQDITAIQSSSTVFMSRKT